VNPWTEKDRLPLFREGVLADVCDGNETTLLDDFQVSESDPAFEYLPGNGASLSETLAVMERPPQS